MALATSLSWELFGLTVHPEELSGHFEPTVHGL